MLRRFLAGSLGTLIGLAVGVPLAFGARVANTREFSMVIAMAVAAIVFGLVRRPPWRQKSAAETLLRAGLGLGVGALIAWLSGRFLDAPLPFAVPPLQQGVSWIEHSGVFAAFVGAITGVLVGVESTPAPDVTTVDI